MARQKFPIPFGGGLDRETGSMVVDTSAQEDLRNVHLSDGLAYVRGGSDETAEFLDPGDSLPMDEVIAGELFRVENVGIIVAYRAATREVRVYRVNRAGSGPVHIGVWFTLENGAVEPPRAFLAEMSGLMFMAHDEPTVSLRAATAYYDPATGTLHALSAGWAHSTEINPAGAENSLLYRKLAEIDTAVTVEYSDPAANSQPLTIAVVGVAIEVSLATDGAGAITSTAAQVRTAILADAGAAALVGVEIDTDDGPMGDGSGVVTAMAAATIANDGIRFRGVTPHLGAYLSGWGYGSATELRPDIVRMSLPGEPTTFELRHYESIGQRGEPVLACHSTGATLLVFKALETWEHFGTNRRNFGKRQLDPHAGILASRLGIVVEGTCFFWSHLGPRVSDGGRPEDIAIPLALHAPEPADLVAEGLSDAAFAVYLPARREIRWHFGQRYFAFSLITKRFSYGETEYEPSIGFLLPGGVGFDVLAGTATSLSITADVNGVTPGLRDITLGWTNTTMVGDEILEVWRRQGSGTWAEIGTMPVSLGATQTYLFEGLPTDTTYTVAIRARRGGIYRPEFDDADPGTWPSASKLTFTTQMPTIVLGFGGWARTSSTDSEMALTWTGNDPTRPTRIFRKPSGGSFAEVFEAAAGVGSYTYPVGVGEGETTLEFYADQETTAGAGPASNTLSAYAGLASPANVEHSPTLPSSWYQYKVVWEMGLGAAGASTRVQDDYIALGTFADRTLTAADATEYTVDPLEKTSTDSETTEPPDQAVPIAVRVRHEITHFTVTDLSQWVELCPVVVKIADDESLYDPGARCP